MRRQKGIPHEQIAQDRLWNKRPDGIVFEKTTTTKEGVIWLLEFKRMSDVINHYIVRGKRETETQYESLRSALAKTMQRQDWMVQQVSFFTEVRSLNEEELKRNLEYFKVPSASVEPIRTKLVMKIFDEYANILKGMYSIDVTEDPTSGVLQSDQVTEGPTTGTLQTAQLWDPHLLFLTLSQSGNLTKLGRARSEGTRRGYN